MHWVLKYDHIKINFSVLFLKKWVPDRCQVRNEFLSTTWRVSMESESGQYEARTHDLGVFSTMLTPTELTGLLVTLKPFFLISHRCKQTQTIALFPISSKSEFIAVPLVRWQTLFAWGHWLSSGRILAFHAEDLGSIPSQCKAGNVLLLIFMSGEVYCYCILSVVIWERQNLAIPRPSTTMY